MTVMMATPGVRDQRYEWFKYVQLLSVAAYSPFMFQEPEQPRTLPSYKKVPGLFRGPLM